MGGQDVRVTWGDGRAVIALVAEDLDEAPEGAGLFAIEAVLGAGDGEVVAEEGGGVEGAGGDCLIPFGRAEVKRAGTDCTVIAGGQGCVTALAAAERLGKPPAAPPPRAHSKK